MKKTKKRIIGLPGLVLVAITTIFAAFLPGPEASAAKTSTVTDTVVLRVSGKSPSVTLSGPTSGSIIVIPKQDLNLMWENVDEVTVSALYTDKDDVEHNYVISSFYANFIPGETTYSLDLLAGEYGYGKYLITAEGIGNDDIKDEDKIEFYFYPVYGEATEDKDSGLIYTNLYYDTESDNISTIKINVYDEDGNLVKEISPITVSSPKTKVELPFSENNLPTGNYTIGITAYDKDGNALYKPYFTDIYYESKVVPVPDTGAFLENLNISRTDYLITGVLIFLSMAVVSLIFVTKGRNSKTK